ncbi:MAG: cell division protein FtsZ [Saprospiraceae bacterium]
MQFNMTKGQSAIIKVIGVGGGGSNAVNNMFEKGIVGVDFAVMNTDNQALDLSPVTNKIQLGPTLTEGRGAGNKPTIGREASIESEEEIKTLFNDDTKMVFITAGMGGGTGTGAAPIIAKVARELDILTVGIVTMPFTFEGRRRQKQGYEGLEELKKNVDTLIIISNDKLREIHGNLSLTAAFSQADNILTTAAKSIAEIITVPGYVNVDFEDVNTVMKGSGVAIMGTATMEGEGRARRAVEAALSSPLLEDNEIKGAEHVLVNITSGSQEVTMDEIFEITEFVQEEAGYSDLIWGNCYDEKLGEKLTVTVIATGFERSRDKQPEVEEKKEKIFVSLDDSNHRPTSHQEQPKTNSGSKSVTFELDASKHKVYSPNNRQAVPKPNAEPIKRERVVRLNNPHTLKELENEPAYIRRKVQLDDVPHSSESAYSNWTLSDDEQPQLRRGNSFLHDNVD